MKIESERRLIKKTIIPIKIQDNPQELNGIIKFTTQKNDRPLVIKHSQLQYKKNLIMYKNQLNNIQEGEDQQKKRKQVEIYCLSIRPAKSRSKIFKVDIPITKGLKSSKFNRNNQLHYTIYLSNNEGKMTLLSGSYDAKLHVKNQFTQKEPSLKKKIEIQVQKLDRRRKNQDFDEQEREDDE